MTKKRANGEGTIYFIEKEQKWRAEITWYDNGGNKQRRTWKSTKQSEVKSKLAEFKKQLLLNGTEISKESKTFRQFSEEWLRVVLKPKLKPTSYLQELFCYSWKCSSLWQALQEYNLRYLCVRSEERCTLHCRTSLPC